jgi:tetratricopeptide (TPR) repeat protein
MLKFILVLTILGSFNFGYGQVTPQKDFSTPESKLMMSEGLRLWQKRFDQQSLEEALSKFEHVYSSHPDNLLVLAYLTRGYFLLAELHHTNEDLKKRNYEKARDFGEKGMRTNEDYRKLSDKDIEKAIGKLTQSEVTIMFWAAAALGNWARLNGLMSSMKYKSQIVAMISRVEELRPDYYYGGVPRFWAAFYAVAPRIAGGDMKKSKKYFDMAMEVAPAYLGTKVLYAEVYLVEKGEKKEFKKVLEEVISSPDGPGPMMPENMLEKKKAERLLEQMDKLF